MVVDDSLAGGRIKLVEPRYITLLLPPAIAVHMLSKADYISQNGWIQRYTREESRFAEWSAVFRARGLVSQAIEDTSSALLKEAPGFQPYLPTDMSIHATLHLSRLHSERLSRMRQADPKAAAVRIVACPSDDVIASLEDLIRDLVEAPQAVPAFSEFDLWEGDIAKDEALTPRRRPPREYWAKHGVLQGKGSGKFKSGGKGAGPSQPPPQRRRT
jgi:hypothetical protein